MNCTTGQYPDQHGCIGTAAVTHGGLPFTGFDWLWVIVIGLVIVIVALMLRLSQRDA